MLNPNNAVPPKVTNRTRVALPTITENQKTQNTAAVPKSERVTNVVKPAKTNTGMNERRRKRLLKVVAIGKLRKLREKVGSEKAGCTPSESVGPLLHERLDDLKYVRIRSGSLIAGRPLSFALLESACAEVAEEELTHCASGLDTISRL